MGAELLRGDPAARFEGVSTDTRTLKAGQLFFAIHGPRFDAHDFLERAIGAGAAGLVVERGRPLPAEAGEDLRVLAVSDTTRALGALAAGHRSGFDGPLVAITGSNGKTTTKEMCAAILARGRPCLKNRGNLNNEFGLPLTLLEREPEHAAIVVEIGMNHRGGIAPLARIARPTVGVITNVGTAHIEFLGSLDEIALEKGDLVASLDAGATAVLNADDPLVLAQARRTPARVVRFGLRAPAEWRAEDVERRQDGFAFRLCGPPGQRAVVVTGLGQPTLLNALAAAAAADAAGATLDEIAAGLAHYRGVPGRMERIPLAGGAVLVNDSYNANPQSTEAALQSLSALRGGGRGLVVLGDMGELGATAVQAHRDAGRRVAELGLGLLVALGEHAATTVAGAVEAGLPPEQALVAADHDDAARAVRARLRPGDHVLVKGSRSMRMERIVETLAEDGEDS
jgi:UDP-N-acetylmuramoyl-tripeptide--D-alanyl-D-alanine ligase